MPIEPHAYVPEKAAADSLCVEVEPGDTVWTLSERVYGRGVHPLAAIYEENHLPVSVRENQGKRSFVAPVIHPGDRLLFPSPQRIPDLQNEFFRHLNYGATDDGAQAHRVLKNGGDHPLAPGKNGGDNPVPEKNPPLVPGKNGGDHPAAPSKGDRDSQSPARPQMTHQQPDLCTRVSHVSEVLADGLTVGTLREGIKQSCQDPLGTAARAGTAIALGAAFGIATGGVGFVAEAAGALAVGMTVAGAWDFLNPYDKKNIERNTNVANNLTAAWNAPAKASMDNLDLAMEKELGRPGFDFALGTLGGFTGARFARPCLSPPGSLPSAKPPCTALVKVGPSTDLVARPLSTTIVPRELFSNVTPNEHIVDALSINAWPEPGSIRSIGSTSGGSSPRLLEDFSKRPPETAGGGGNDSLQAITADKVGGTVEGIKGLSRLRGEIRERGGTLTEVGNHLSAYFWNAQRARLSSLSRNMTENGIPFKPTQNPCAGWKIHLATEADKNDALTQEIAQHLVQQKISFKIGRGGLTDDGKGMTIYVGDRDTMLAVAKDLEHTFMERLPKIPPESDAAYDDEMIGNSGAIAARFDLAEKGTGMNDFHQYGYHGVPFHNYYIDRYQTFRTQLNKLPPEQQAKVLAEVQAEMREELTGRFGAFFAGSAAYPR